MMGSAPLKFAPANGLESVFTAARRFDRLPRWMCPLAWLPPPDPRKPDNNTYSGVVRLTH
jgi:hypothetical protein